MADAITTKNITSVDEVQSVDNTDKVFVNDNGSFKQISVSNLMKQAPSGVTEETDPTVSEWAKQPTKPSYTADEVGALPVGTKIPTKTSDLTNDSGYLTQIPEEYVTETELGQKGYVIEDDIPEKLPSPGILTFTGAVNDTYDGSTNKTINIPTGGGEGGTSDYNALANKPQLNGVEIVGNKTSADYKIVSSEQGAENNGKFLGVGADGNVTPVDKPTYTANEVGARPNTWTPSAEDVGALPNNTEIPSKTSDLENDSGFITNSDIPEKLPNPQKIIFTGAVTAEYDGSSQQTINIPTGGESNPYTLPIMSSTQLGGGKAVAKTDEDVPVAVDPSTGQLFVPTYPENTGGGGGTAQNGIPSGGTTGQVLAKKTDNDYDVVWKDIESSSAGSDLIFTNETNYSASVNDLEEVGENQYVPVTNSLMFIPSSNGVLKVGSDNLIGEPYSASVNELLKPTVSFEKIQDGYSLSYNEEYTGVKIFQNQRFGFSTSLKTGSTYTISLKNESTNKSIYVYGCNIEKEAGDLLGTIQDGKLTFTVSKDYIYIRIPCSDLPENLTEITLAEGEVALEYGGSATEYSVEKDVPLYIKNVKGLNCVGSGKFYASPFAIIELNGMKTYGSAKTYSTDKYYVNMGDSIWTFGSSTGGIGNISDYMKELCGGTWINICTGGTTMANRPGEYAGNYDVLDFHALADCIASGDFSSAKGSGLTTNLDDNVDSIVWGDVDIITVCYGTNDLAFGGTIENEENVYDKDTVCGALRYGIKTITAIYPNIKFMVMGILYRWEDGVNMRTVAEWNEKLRFACDMCGATFVPMDCGINEGNRSTFLYDGTHPNEQGKIAVAKTVAKKIINI